MTKRVTFCQKMGQKCKSFEGFRRVTLYGDFVGESQIGLMFSGRVMTLTFLTKSTTITLRQNERVCDTLSESWSDMLGFDLVCVWCKSKSFKSKSFKSKSSLFTTYIYTKLKKKKRKRRERMFSLSFIVL